MQRNDRCIRYLMNEMDPSEVLEFEREMMEDEDLLIDVECMRQALKSVSNLPLFMPSENLTQEIIDRAVEERCKCIRNQSFFYRRNFRLAAAAVVILGGVSIGLFSMNKQPLLPSDTTVYKKNTAEQAPWVDKQNNLNYTDFFTVSGSSDLDLEQEKSLKKLRPLGSLLETSERSASNVTLTKTIK